MNTLLRAALILIAVVGISNCDNEKRQAEFNRKLIENRQSIIQIQVDSPKEGAVERALREAAEKEAREKERIAVIDSMDALAKLAEKELGRRLEYNGSLNLSDYGDFLQKVLSNEGGLEDVLKQIDARIVIIASNKFAVSGRIVRINIYASPEEIKQSLFGTKPPP